MNKPLDKPPKSSMVKKRASGPPKGGFGSKLGSALSVIAPYSLSAAVFISLWYWATLSIPPLLFPSPARVAETGWQVLLDGTLLVNMGASLARILAGFIIGSLLGVLVGLLMGSYEPVRYAVEPYSEFFRFIPGIAMSVLAIVWFGTGELSRVFITFYSTIFTVMINTDVAVRGVKRNRIRAALCLGARPSQVFFHVTLPSCMPMILAGMRIAMGFSFATIISAELLAAESGLGFMISSARLFMQSDRMFVAIVALGALGLGVDSMFRVLIRRFAERYVATG